MGVDIGGGPPNLGRRTGLANVAEREVGVRTPTALFGHNNIVTRQRNIDLRPVVMRVAVDWFRFASQAKTK